MGMDIKKTIITFKRIEEICSIIHQRVQADGFKPDLLLSIARGGSILGALLGCEQRFNIPHSTTINVASYDESNQQKELRLLLPVHTEDYKGFKSILVVDDIADTGDTLKFVTDILQKDLTIATIKTAVLFYKLKSKVMPDYYVEETADWIVFPWEK